MCVVGGKVHDCGGLIYELLWVLHGLGLKPRDR